MLTNLKMSVARLINDKSRSTQSKFEDLMSSCLSFVKFFKDTFLADGTFETNRMAQL